MSFKSQDQHLRFMIYSLQFTIYNFQIKTPYIEEGISGGVENLRASGSKGRNASGPCPQEIHILQPVCF